MCPCKLPGGLSLGDRYCLALAKREGIPAWTAEHRWPDIATAADVTVNLSSQVAVMPGLVR